MTNLFVSWLYFDAPNAYWQTLRDLLLGLINYFSLPLLTKTLFAPWRHDAVDITRLPVNQWFPAIISNIVSRFMGFIVRSITILIGCIIIAITAMVSACLIICWYLLPLLLIASLIYGITLILGGANG